MKTRCNYDYSLAKNKYRELCRQESSVNIYMQDWYLDAVTDQPDDWRVVLFEEGGVIMAAFPFQYVKRHGLYYIENPWQSARGGIWFRPQDYKSKLDELLRQREMVEEIIKCLPPYDSFCIDFHAGFHNWQYFYWNGFSESVHYSQIIRPTGEDFLQSVSRKRKKQITRSNAKYSLSTLSEEEYWSFLEYSYRTKEKRLSYDREVFMKLLHAVMEQGQAVIRAARNEAGEVVAACVVLQDAERCYHQFGSQLKNQDKEAKSVLVFHAISSCLESGRIFDFEGSMIPGVCEFNASFNPEWEPYHVVMKYSKKYTVLKSMLQIVRAIFKSTD